MKYSLFLFFIAMLLNQSAFAEWASNKTCAPVMQTCMSNYSAKYGSRYNTPAAKAALAQCNVTYEDCATNNGVIKQDSGSYAQMYHPANPDYIACKKTIDDANSDAFRRCMKDRTQPAPKPVAKAPEENTGADIIVTGLRLRCSPEEPEKCKTMYACMQNHGVWNGTCTMALCPMGSTPDNSDPTVRNKCKCDNEFFASVERGNYAQKCPSQCPDAEHKQYAISTKSCMCDDGFEMQNGNCVAKSVQPVAAVDCLRELQEKVTSCNSAASTAVDKCNPNREQGSGEGDSLSALQSLLGGVNGYTKAKNAGSGAIENCVNAGLASSTGYYALEELRGKCDGEIATCKSSCSDATSQIAANKERAYQACRKKAYDDNRNSTNFPYNNVSEDIFNVDWDRINKAPFDSQIKDMQKNVADNNTKCESGIAVTNRDKMSDFMNDMNTSVKSANQCQCQLGASGQDCNNQVGPADCAANPALPGCANATVNCLNAADKSVKCVCFRDPNSSDCKTLQQANNGKINATETSSFAGAGGTNPNVSGFAGGTSGKTESSDVNVGDLSDLGANGEAIAADASGTATADAGSPFGAAAGGSGSGASAGADGTTAAGPNGEEEGSIKKIGGLFDVAKTALGNLFKKGSNDKSSFDGVNSQGQNGANNSGLDSKKWRPRGMVRGLAGDTEIGGKFEDIWKVMNKQYKVQDQKDSFIFGGEKQ